MPLKMSLPPNTVLCELWYKVHFIHFVTVYRFYVVYFLIKNISIVFYYLDILTLPSHSIARYSGYL